MRFCLQCGSSLAPAAAPSPPVKAEPQKPTVPLKIAVTPALTPRPGPPPEHPRPTIGNDRLEIDEESIKKAFQKPVARPGVIVCRFCKGPLDLNGEFCEQCGAPVAEAAPPGAKKATPSAVTPPPAVAPVVEHAPAANPPHAAHPLAASTSGNHPGATPLPLPAPAEHATPTHPTPTRTPVPAAPAPAAPPPADSSSSGFMGRLKGIFKKG